jgi:hypothetical protein
MEARSFDKQPAGLGPGWRKRWGAFGKCGHGRHMTLKRNKRATRVEAALALR